MKNERFIELSRLGYAIQGKRGGKPQIKDDIGSVCVFIDSKCGCQKTGGNVIEVDAFEGSGYDYQRREKSSIRVINEGKEVFTGTFDELVERLTDKRIERQETNDAEVLE